GGGPIHLPPTPVFDVFMPESGLLRTGVLEDYDGQGNWSLVRGALPNLASHQVVAAEAVPETKERVNFSQPLFVYPLAPSPDRIHRAPSRRVKQTIVARASTPPRVPVLDHP